MAASPSALPAPALPAEDTRFTVANYFSVHAAPFWLVHLASLAIFFVPFSWSLVGLCVAMYVVRMWAITAGYHRYFSHRTYKTGRVFQLVLAVIGTASVQKGVLWWAANHRHHHRHSDQPDDLHSPGLSGFLWAHMGWFLCHRHDDTDYERIADFAKYPELVWLNKYHLVPGVAMAVLLFAIGGLPWLVWGFFLSTTLLWHGTFVINSLTHVFGRRRYATTDDSRNSFLLALITLGEGWHNNHHYYKSSTRQGFYWWEIDISFYVLKALSWVGVVDGIKEPPRHIMEANRIDRGVPDDRKIVGLPAPRPVREELAVEQAA
jgi:stearoyl-CoA desaturase (delta-9 desaturase)